VQQQTNTTQSSTQNTTQQSSQQPDLSSLMNQFMQQQTQQTQQQTQQQQTQQPNLFGNLGNFGNMDPLMGNLDMNQFNQMMQDPFMQQMVTSLMSNPQFMQQVSNKFQNDNTNR
jgi:hypothetical protein